jgi:SAM-dependent methyltransferase
MLRFFGSSDVKHYVERFLRARLDLRGKRIVDLPAGKGYMSAVLRELGADVHAYDLFPQFFSVDGMSCTEADLTGPLPIEDRSANLVLCQEGIEHLSDQFLALREFNRILCDGGTLIITTPSISHLRARMSNLLTESELYKRMPPNELDAVWHSGEGKVYFGHLFLLGIQKLRTLAVASGFRLKAVHPVKASPSSLLLGFLYPLIALVNFWSYLRNVYRNDGIPRAEKQRVYGEIVRLNLHPTILFGRHLFVEFEKVAHQDAVELYVNQRS